MKILIVEDHTVLKIALKKLLESVFNDAMVIGAANARQCYSMLNQHSIDIVILDLNLPQTHGFVVLDEIAMQWPQTKVLVLSGDSYEESGLQSIYKGAWCYLDKAVDPDILIEAIETLYKGHKYYVPQINELLIKPHIKPGDKLPHETLSKREYEVMILLAKEKKYKEISEQLGISEKSVGTNRTNITIKMGIKKNTEITAYCKLHKLI
jgi:two-component system, NarL family, invasion response regulator UvrY